MWELIWLISGNATHPFSCLGPRYTPNSLGACKFNKRRERVGGESVVDGVKAVMLWRVLVS